MGNTKGFANLCKLKFHYLYETTNNVNGKRYRGRHSTDNLEDGYLGSGKLLRRSINKYGEESFSCKIIEHFDDVVSLINAEKDFVNREWCEDNSNYNLVEGGSNPIMYGENNPSWRGGVVYEPKGPHDFSGENNPMWGAVRTEEHKIKNMFGQKTRVVFMGGGVEYNSVRECSRATGMSRDGIKYRIKSTNFKDWYKII